MQVLCEALAAASNDLADRTCRFRMSVLNRGERSVFEIEVAVHSVDPLFVYAPTSRRAVDVFGRTPRLTAHFPGHADPDFAFQNQFGSGFPVFPAECRPALLLLLLLLQARLFAQTRFFCPLGVYRFGRGEDHFVQEGAVP